MPPEQDEHQAVAVAAAAGAGAPCGACRALRRRCVPGCVFAPYFTAEEDFAAVHGVFGASNVSRMLERVEAPEQRAVAAATLVEEARARARDPTFGCVSYLRILQEVNDRAREQVDEKREQIAREFGDLAAASDVASAAASPAVRAEARAQVDAALKHAREQDARLRGVREANEVRWRELHPQQAAGTGTGKHAAADNGKGPDVVKRRRSGPPSLSEQQTMPTPRTAKQRSHQQMALAEASREEATRSVQAPAATAPPPQQHHDSAGHHAGTGGQPRHAGEDAAGRTQGQGGTSVLLEAMMQLAGAGDGQQNQQQQQLVAPENDHDMTQDMMQQLQQLLDMAELARKQKLMGQWDAAAGGGAAREQEVTTTMQHVPGNSTWPHHQDPATQYGGFRGGPHHQEMPQQMEEAASTCNDMSQQFAWAQQYHDPGPAAAHQASPWHRQIGEARQPAAASASQVAAGEQDMLLLLQQQQQHQVAAAELVSAAGGGARQFDNLAAGYDDTELTLGYGHGHGHHSDMPHQQVAAAGAQQHAENGHQDAETQAVLRELAAMVALADERATARKQWEQDAMKMTPHRQSPDDAWLLEKLEQMEKAEMERKQEEMLTRQFVATARAREQELITQQQAAAARRHHHQQQHPVEQKSEMERAKMERIMRQYVATARAREQQELITQRAAAAHQPPQRQPVPQTQYSEIERIMRLYVASARAREQAAAAQQQRPVVRQYSGAELDLSPGAGQGHPYWHQPTVPQMLREQQLAEAVGFGRRHSSSSSSRGAAPGEHGSGAGSTMAFLSPGSANDAPFLADQQQPQPNGHQMGSSLPPLPSSLSQLHAHVSHQERTDAGGQGLNSDLAAYLHCDESLSRQR